MRNHIATIRLFLAFTQGSEELNLRANVPELCVRGPSVQQINDKLFVTPGSKLA